MLHVSMNFFSQGLHMRVRWHFSWQGRALPCLQHHSGAMSTTTVVHVWAHTRAFTRAPSLIKIAEDITHPQCKYPYTGISAVQVGESGKGLCYPGGITTVSPKDMKLGKQTSGTQFSGV